jgi:hypothetical protein
LYDHYSRTVKARVHPWFFDRHPTLNVVLGGLGDGLPFEIWRIDHRDDLARGDSHGRCCAAGRQ